MSKRKKIVLISLISLFAVLFSAVMIYYFGASYKEFDVIAKKEFNIPGLETSFVPQGMTYVESENCFLIAGYMSDGSASRVYVVDKTTGETEKYITLKIGQNDYVGHAGGIADYNDNIYLVGDKLLVRFSLSALLSCENGLSVNVIDTLETGNGCDFVLVKGENLIVGEFYKKDKYDTPAIHHIETQSGTNYALTYVYRLNETNSYGLESTVPTYAISMANQVQGMAFNKDGEIILSTSYSIPSSVIYKYENILSGVATKNVVLNGNNVPVYVLSDENLISTLKAPSMSEEIELVDGRIYVLFESNCKKYRLVNRTRLSNVYSLDI